MPRIMRICDVVRPPRIWNREVQEQQRCCRIRGCEGVCACRPPREYYTEAEGATLMNKAIGWHNRFLCAGRLPDGHFVIRWRAGGDSKAALETGRPDIRGRRTSGRHALPEARNRIIPQKHFD